MTQIDHISTLAVAPTGSSAPDSITLANGDVWVAYTNGADSTGLQGRDNLGERPLGHHFADSIFQTLHALAFLAYSLE
jgi:hypothetical protein